MAIIKKAQPGRLIKNVIKGAAEKVTIPPGLKKSIKKSQSGPTKITPYSSEAERIAAGGPTNLQKYKTVNKFDPDYQKPYKPKKQPKVDKYGFDTRPDRNGGMHKKKMKTGGSIPKAQNGKLTKAELDALSHQKRGMGEVNSTYVKKAGSIMNDTGVLTNSQKEQLKKHMSKASTAKKIYEALPNVGRIFGHGNSAADIPKGSQLEKQRKGGAVKKKMRNGGSLSGLTASTKRDKGTDPKGAFTKVQKRTLAGARGKASLTKDKQLGATKMKMGGKMKKC
jgi:hypothetical protein